MGAIALFMSGIHNELVYVKLLLFSCFCSYLAKRLPSNRDWFGAIVGLLMVIVVCGNILYYSLITAVVNIIIIAVAPVRRATLISFCFTFGYLGLLRCADLVGLPKPVSHSNGVQLLMTLRSIGLVFEVTDARLANKKDDSRYVSRDCLISYFLYLYNFAGLFTGPYYSYKVYSDMVNSKHLNRVPIAGEIAQRLLIVPVLSVILFISGSLFPLSYMSTDAFYTELSFASRLAYMSPVLLFFRMRVYIAWKLSESSCIINGLGAYPAVSKPKVGKGPTDIPALNKALKQLDESKEPVAFNFKTVQNIDMWQCEMADTIRQSMRGWNSCVQYWLATYVYTRCPRRGRTAVTMAVSAFWHGIHPGYYLSFLSVPLCTHVEDLWWSIMRPSTPTAGATSASSCGQTSAAASRYALFGHCWWFFKVRAFEFMSSGFLLLSWGRTMRYWASVYFALHGLLLALGLAGHLVKALGRVRARKSGMKGE